MGILVNFDLNNSFRLVKRVVKAPEHFCVTRIEVANNAKKERRKKIEVIVRKRNKNGSASCPRAPFIGHATIQSAGAHKVP